MLMAVLPVRQNRACGALYRFSCLGKFGHAPTAVGRGAEVAASGLIARPRKAYATVKFS
jgi:hypothetical protein